MIRTAVFGASGYAGGELVKLIDGHDGLDLVYLGAHSHAGGVLGEVHPQLPNGERPLGANEPGAAGEIDLAFIALPHGSSAAIGQQVVRDAVSRWSIWGVTSGSTRSRDMRRRMAHPILFRPR